MKKRMQIKNFPELDYACEEAINTLCTNLSFYGDKQKCVMITSCHANEGKTFISMNLMRSLAKLGKSVVLVDADLRRSVINSRYEVEVQKCKGLANYLAGMCEADDIINITNIYDGRLISVGRQVSNSLSLLSGDRFPKLIDELTKNFDIVLIDAPPVGVVIDAAEIAKCCTGTLFVIQYNETRRKELQDANRQIERTGCPVLGAVLNGVSFNSYSSKKYYNKYYYSNYNSEYRKQDKHVRNARKKRYR